MRFPRHFTFLVALTLVISTAALFGAAAVASARTGPAVRAVWGTPAAADGRQPGVPADQSNQAVTSFYSADLHGGYLAAGTAMRNLGHGHVRIGQIPEGASIRAAFLVWDELDSTPAARDAEGRINGHPITGTLAATGHSPCWHTVHHNYTFVADVTQFVSGNARYQFNQFASGQRDGQDPWDQSLKPMIEGATLFVVYEDEASPMTHVDLAAGATEFDGSLVSATFDGFTIPDSPAVKTTFAIADGQTGKGEVTRFNAQTLHPTHWEGHDRQDVPDYSLGNLWDTRTYDVSRATTPGQTSATISLDSPDDCLVWVGQALSVNASD